MDLSDAALRERKDIARVLYDEWDCVHTETMRREYNEDGHEDFANLAPAELAQWLAVADKAIALRDAARAEQRELIAQVNDIANDCEQVSAMDIVDQAERRTWRSIAKALRAAAIRAQGGEK